MKLVLIAIEKVENTTMVIIMWSGITNEWRKNQNEKKKCFCGSWTRTASQVGKRKVRIYSWLNESLYGKPYMFSFLKYSNFHEKRKHLFERVKAGLVWRVNDELWSPIVINTMSVTLLSDTILKYTNIVKSQ